MRQIEFYCSLSAMATPLPHFWEHTVGSCHAAIALRADWQSQLRRCHDELGFRYVRFHGLLSDDVGALIRHKEEFLYLGTELLQVEGSHENVDAWVVRKKHSLTVLFTNHALPRHPIETEQVKIRLTEAPHRCRAYVERIDHTHANPNALVFTCASYGLRFPGCP